MRRGPKVIFFDRVVHPRVALLGEGRLPLCETQQRTFTQAFRRDCPAFPSRFLFHPESFRGKLAVNRHQRSTWHFPRAPTTPRHLSFRLGWIHRGYWRSPFCKTARKPVPTRGNRAHNRLRPRLMEIGPELSRARRCGNAAPSRNQSDRELSIKKNYHASHFHGQGRHARED